MKKFGKLAAKLLAIALVSALALFLLTACGDKGEQPSGTSGNTTGASANQTSGSSGKQPESSSAGNDTAGKRLSAAYAGMMKGGKYYMKYSTEMEAEGEKVQTKAQMAYEGDNYASISEMNMGGMAIKSRTIKKGDAMYSINDAAKTVMKIAVPTSPEKGKPADFSGLNYLGDGKGTVNGKSLPYEEYGFEGGTLRYYFDGKKLYAMESKMTEATMLMLVEEFSDKIPAGIFDIPTDYQTVGMP